MDDGTVVYSTQSDVGGYSEDRGGKIKKCCECHTQIQNVLPATLGDVDISNTPLYINMIKFDPREWWEYEEYKYCNPYIHTDCRTMMSRGTFQLTKIWIA